MKKLLFVMIDGFGDLNIPNNNEKIHQEDFFSSIQTSNLSKYFLSANDSYYGMMDPVEPGLACGSDTAHLSIFGFNPLNFYSGRGAFETIGAGISMSPGEIAFKCNFAYMDISTKQVILRRSDKDFAKESSELCNFLQDELNKKGSILESEGISVTVKHATEHRCGIKIKKNNYFLSDRITGTDPLYDNMPLIECRSISPDDKAADATSYIINRVSDMITALLSKHYINEIRALNGKPLANVILFRGCSKAPYFPKFDSFHNVDWNSLMMARTCIISGIGQCLNFKIIAIPNEENFIENHLSIEKDMSIFLDNLLGRSDCRFSFFHIKAVDEASHEQDYYHKLNLIQSIDKIIGIVIECLRDKFNSDEFRIVVTGDHSTLCRIGEHSCEPVPFLVSRPLNQSNLDHGENENSKILKCFSSNSIGRFSGECAIEFLKNLLNK